MILHQSDLSAWSRCPAEYGYKRAGMPDKGNSARAFGSVLHFVIEQLERTLAESRQQYGPASVEFADAFAAAVQTSLQTFVHYWNPLHIEDITEPVPNDGWLPRQGYSELRVRGLDSLRKYADLIRFDDHELLATEYGFLVPIAGTWDDDEGAPHQLAGSIDRLAVRHFSRKPAVAVDDWKGLALDTLIPTPAGWSTMAELAVGDEVFGRDGRPCRVTAKSEVHENRLCYRVTFDDRTSVVADDVHLWDVQAGPEADQQCVLSTVALQRALIGSDEPRHHWIRNADPLVLPDVDLPVPPYVLGLSHQPIDKCYLRASVGQRLSLLQGLMDASGSWGDRHCHQAVFWTNDQQLACRVFELVCGLGMKSQSLWVRQDIDGETVTSHNVSFIPLHVSPFRAEGKVRMLTPGSTAAGRRLVIAVDSVRTVPTQCIEVDSADSLYLCGKAMVPTHNTGKEQRYLRHNVQFSAYSYATTLPEFWIGHGGEDGFGPERGQQLYERFKDAGRRGTWINLRTFKYMDAGWRGPKDYERFKLAVTQLAMAIKADIFPLSISGETCMYCQFRDVCGGTGLPANDYGDPTKALPVVPR